MTDCSVLYGLSIKKKKMNTPSPFQSSIHLKTAMQRNMLYIKLRMWGAIQYQGKKKKEGKPLNSLLNSHFKLNIL